VLSDGDIELEDIPSDIRRAVEYGLDVEAVSGGYPAINAAQLSAAGAAGEVPDFREARDAFEKDYLQKALSAAKGNVSEASRQTGLSRRHFYEKMEKLGLKDDR
jgi:DNA-binding NtrC family response regulator